ncbi:MAG: hypothetical protein KC619_01465 [Myxococcales bacterium]|nr:hypothetical protein [Myxococcales bacterium]
MESLLFHPKVVHVPIALAVLMPLIAGGLALAWWREWLPRRAWLVAAALQAVMLLGGFASLRTGEAEEERVEEVVPERAIHEHEEAAEVFVGGSLVVLLVMLAAAFVPKEKVALGLAAASVVGAVAVLGLGYRVGEAGGALVYRHDAARAYAGTTAGPPAADADRAIDEDDEDD